MLRYRSSEMENLRADLEAPRYEVLPIDGIEEEMQYLPEDAQVSVTCSPDPKYGIKATIDVAEMMATERKDIEVIPHLAAREILNKDHLKEIMHRMGEAGIHGAFIVGGDGEAKGDYWRSLRLIEDIHDIREEEGMEMNLGITGYPEGHPKIADEMLMDDLLEKQQYAGYVATQLCFDSQAVLDWAAKSREQGLELPVEVSIPGSMDPMKLFKISQKIGVGESAKYLQKTTGIKSMLNTLFRPNDHMTNKLTNELAPYLHDDTHNLSGFHIASFNNIEGTEKWRQRKLSKLPKSK